MIISRPLEVTVYEVIIQLRYVLFSRLHPCQCLIFPWLAGSRHSELNSRFYNLMLLLNKPLEWLTCMSLFIIPFNFFVRKDAWSTNESRDFSNPTKHQKQATVIMMLSRQTELLTNSILWKNSSLLFCPLRAEQKVWTENTSFRTGGSGIVIKAWRSCGVCVVYFKT